MILDMKYNKEADKFLKGFYNSVGAKTFEQKYNVLMIALGIDPKNQTFSHNPTWKQKVGMLEYELLENKGLIELTSA